MLTEVTLETLAQIVESVFTTMLDLEVTITNKPWIPDGDRMTSFVHLTGDWSGAVMLECSRRQACLFAGRILLMDPPDTVDDDVRDVLGELANMIGGNMKCTMPMGVCLSMPTVMDGSDYDLRICGSKLQKRQAFNCADGPFWVTVLATEGDQLTGDFHPTIFPL
jgi:chemotaxis protein CheX